MLQDGTHPGLLPILGFAVSMAMTPGPNNAMAAASGASFGLRATLPQIAGVAIGMASLVLAAALGAAVLLTAYPGALLVLRYLSFGYLLWLAWCLARAEPAMAGGGSEVAGSPLGFAGAALFQWVNPKAWLAAGSGAVAYGADAAVILALVFLGVSMVSTLAWTLVGLGAARILRSRRRIRMFNVLMASLLIASMLPVILGR
ncbi:LysE family translocator [Roseococcus sp. SYP-B2431]|uniref:LysE family translocator n=1 Tax=Roseococcus sp. SYP-B2431 TaxID=2496640 RepID=UPI001F0FF5A9|nr:LysE family transporter [Roseococcus sp. SYP-B2431]